MCTGEVEVDTCEGLERTQSGKPGGRTNLGERVHLGDLILEKPINFV